MEIKKGTLFRCVGNIKTTYGYDKPFFSYRKGKIYKSDIDGCITDERGDKNHNWGWLSDSKFPSYFKLYHPCKRKSRYFEKTNT